MADPFATARALADLYGRYIDEPNDPNARGTLRDRNFYRTFDSLARQHGYTPADIGFLQQNPQYRGIRMVLPQSGGSYGQATAAQGLRLADSGISRVLSQGPIGRPDQSDPHQNAIPLVPRNWPPDMNALREETYGELIRRGYPVLGGTGDFGGDFRPGFNPIGFGQR